jgi:putative colanic acid biosynthesis UDP-glucose lipid carrier transferase
LSVREQLAEERDWAAPEISGAPAQAMALRLVPPVLPPGEDERIGATAIARSLKRGLDLLVALPLLVLLAPLLAVVALAVRLDSAGPALFRQRRLGRNGGVFRILKFRTLHVVEDGDQIRQVTKDDPRLTRIGSFLRRTSIDELPQLINVVRGEMSLVGPRPHALAHDRYYTARIQNYALRQIVKPGITGWAQVHGFRGETATLEEMRRRIDFDVWYATRADLLLDLRILLATPRALLRGNNAQ